jgi:hypothetical protein
LVNDSPTAPTTNLFFKSHNPGYKDIVTIQFDLTPTSGSTKAENQVGISNTVHFNESVGLR